MGFSLRLVRLIWFGEIRLVWKGVGRARCRLATSTPPLISVFSDEQDVDLRRDQIRCDGMRLRLLN
jgi:hypothetical protein